jgi:hypothetical protein
MFDRDLHRDPYRSERVRRWSLKPAFRSHVVCAALAFAVGASLPEIALADEGGVSFWVPGFFGSLAAAPQVPGWSLATIYYHTSVSAGADVALAREFQIGRIPANLSANLNASLNATGDLGFVIPSYVFATPVLGGQASASLLGAYGTTSATLAGTLTGSLTGPGGVVFPFGPRFDSISSTAWGIADLVPQFA